jgi:hypothetical protein
MKTAKRTAWYAAALAVVFVAIWLVLGLCSS